MVTVGVPVVVPVYRAVGIDKITTPDPPDPPVVVCQAPPPPPPPEFAPPMPPFPFGPPAPFEPNYNVDPVIADGIPSPPLPKPLADVLEFTELQSTLLA